MLRVQDAVRGLSHHPVSASALHPTVCADGERGRGAGMALSVHFASTVPVRHIEDADAPKSDPRGGDSRRLHWAATSFASCLLHEATSPHPSIVSLLCPRLSVTMPPVSPSAKSGHYSTESSILAV
jgi:hypothetical protein